MALAVQFIRINYSMRQALVFLVPFSLIAPAGVLVGSFLQGTSPWAELILGGLAAGAR